MEEQKDRHASNILLVRLLFSFYTGSLFATLLFILHGKLLWIALFIELKWAALFSLVLTTIKINEFPQSSEI